MWVLSLSWIELHTIHSCKISNVIMSVNFLCYSDEDYYYYVYDEDLCIRLKYGKCVLLIVIEE